MKIGFNLNSVKNLRLYKKNIMQHSKSINNITTGKKINSAKDNPNRLSDLKSFDRDIRSYQASRRNIQDSVSMTQAADGVMDSVGSNITRLKEISVNLGNSVLEPEQKEIVQMEVNQIIESIDYEVKNFSFNGKNIIHDESVVDNEEPGSLEVMTSINIGDLSKIPTFNLSSEVLGISDIDFTDKNQNIDDVIVKLDNAHSQLIGARTKIGSVMSGFEDKIGDSESMQQIVSGAKSDIEDSDIALEMIDFTKTLILQESSIKTLSQSMDQRKEFVNIISNLFR